MTRINSGTVELNALIRNRALILLMNDFFDRLQKNEKKDTPYPHARTRRLLKESGLR